MHQIYFFSCDIIKLKQNDIHGCISAESTLPTSFNKCLYLCSLHTENHIDYATCYPTLSSLPQKGNFFLFAIEMFIQKQCTKQNLGI